jgi:hypothetical protein
MIILKMKIDPLLLFMMAGFIFFACPKKAHHGCDLARRGAFHGYTGEKEKIFRSVYSFLFALYNILTTSFRTLLVPNLY